MGVFYCEGSFEVGDDGDLGDFVDVVIFFGFGVGEHDALNEVWGL